MHKETLAGCCYCCTRNGLQACYYGTINNEVCMAVDISEIAGLYGTFFPRGWLCGFGLYYQPTAMNIKCQVIALPAYQNQHRQNQKMIIDAPLARLLWAGELTSFGIPDLTWAKLRDLTRARSS